MKVLAIYPGRFHPFHRGHKSVYDWLVKKFGSANVYITTTSVIDPIKSPFSFEEKKQMMVLSGIPSEKILNVKNNYNITEITRLLPDLDVKNTAVFFTVSEKDMNEEPRFSTFTKKDGTPTYLQKIPTDQSQIASAARHGYLIVAPTENFELIGKKISSASEIRRLFSSSTPDVKRKIFTDMFGSFDEKLFKVLSDKLQNVELKESLLKLMTEDLDDTLKTLLKKRDGVDMEIEKIKLRQIEERIKNVEELIRKSANSADRESFSKKLSDLKKELNIAKKRVSIASTRRS